MNKSSEKILQIFKNHYLAITLSIITGLFNAFFIFYTIFLLGSDYKGIPYLYSDSEDVYLSRIHEILEGNILIKSPYYFDYKTSGEVMQLPYGEMLYALVSKITNIDIVNVFHLSKFFLPLFAFLSIYYFCYILFEKRSKIYPNLIAFFCSFGYQLCTPAYIKSFLLNTDFGYLPGYWFRSVNPVIGGIEIFVVLSILFKIYANKKTNSYLILLAGVLYGISSAYFFSYGVLTAFTVFLAIYLYFKRDFIAAKKSATILLIGTLINLPYFYNVVKSMLFPGIFENNSERIGLFFTHIPIHNTFLDLSIVTTCCTLLFLKYHKKLTDNAQSALVFLGILSIAGYSSLNIQIFTGFTVWPAHFVQYTVLFTFISVLTSVYFLLTNYKTIYRLFISVVFIVILCLALKDTSTYYKRLDDYREVQKYAFLRDNFKDLKECVVLFSEGYDKGARLLPAISNCDVYISHHNYFNIPESSVYDRYLAYLKINDVKDASKHLEKNVFEINKLFFQNWGELYIDDTYKWLRQSSDDEKNFVHIKSVIANIIKDYPKYYKQNFSGYINNLKKYKISHIVVDKRFSKIELRNFKDYENSVKLISENKTFEIWEVK